MKSLRNKTKNLLVSLCLIGSILGSNLYADSVFIDKGKPAPFSGILFTEEKAQELRSSLLEADKTKLQYETEKHRSSRLGQILTLKDEEIELYAKQNQRLLKANERSDTLNYVWFGLGILATGLAVYGAGSLAR
jgi:hypothetical protein